MASYDLRCRSCGKDFEVFQLGFLKEEAKVCPDCGAREVEQRFTGFGGVLGLSASCC
jgi:putative FmdB family regulatory protein